MQIFNTLSRKKEDFKTIEKDKVGIFVCGPTVYDYSHIGHARTYIVFDVIARYLRHKGYKVNFVMNITDIDDKIIQRAKEEKKSWKEIADFYETAFMEDIKQLGIDVEEINFARATEHIPEIIKQIKILMERGVAYQTEDGVYFNISEFPDYGKLAGRTAQQAEDAVSRIDESIHKKNKGDFALWRLSKEDEPAWSFKTGKYLGVSDGSPAFAKASAGKPGWHIEDTAIVEKQLGQQIDIHCGGQDLVFPHHEGEIAQAESISGKKPYAKFWLHSGFITVNGKKMSKSLGNFITIRDLLKEYSPEALRFMALSAHYRSPIDYKEDLMKQSEAGVQRIAELVDKLEFIKKGAAGKTSQIDIENLISETKRNFEQKMEDDFNTPEVLAVLFDFIKKINTLIDNNKIDSAYAEKIIGLFKNIDEILGILAKKRLEIPQEIVDLVSKREGLRKENNFPEADKIRRQIQEKGYEIDDTPYGPLIKKAN